MRIVTNPGSNLSAETVAHYDIDLSPQLIVVDGVRHDTRGEISLEDVDAWIQNAKEHPHVLGTAASEFASLFRALAERDSEILAVMTSKKIISSYAAALTAAKQLEEHPRYKHVKIRVVDSGVSDLGTGFLSVLAAEARRAGLGLDAVANLLEVASARVLFCLYLATLENLVKGGRASFLRAWLANVLKVRPMLTFRDGELFAAAKIKTTDDPSEQIALFLSERIGPTGPVWLGVAHGRAEPGALLTAAAVRRRFDASFCCVKPLASSIYLHVGPGGIGAFLLPLDGLPWRPPPTPFLT